MNIYFVRLCTVYSFCRTILCIEGQLRFLKTFLRLTANRRNFFYPRLISRFKCSTTRLMQLSSLILFLPQAILYTYYTILHTTILRILHTYITYNILLTTDITYHTIHNTHYILHTNINYNTTYYMLHVTCYMLHITYDIYVTGYILQGYV